VKNEIGWQQEVNFEQGLEKTVDWYLENEEWLNHVLTGEYEEYYRKQYLER
jgi:dTDP-glucose 4,6-dehydratase